MKTKENDDNTSILALLLASNGITNPNCTTSSVSAITSKLTQVPNSARTKYSISACDAAGFATIGLSSSGITLGATGTSTSSLIGSTGDISLDQSKGGTSVEVTFTINNSSGYIDVIAYGSGTSLALSGPTYRLAAGAQAQYKKSADGSFANTSKGSSVSAPISNANTAYTYCLDFQYTATGMRYMNGWDKACSSVSSTERGSMMYYPIMQMMNVPVYTSGSKIGFVLNGATITSFTVGTILSETE
ncbi:MAG: hypothetical protein L6Q54_14840 [Leptospiraceae bacterium]|nr:hypothetical protein [Leptospiraceae bacterium]